LGFERPLRELDLGEILAQTFNLRARATLPAAPEPRPSLPQPSTKIHCVYCGAENQPDAVFCQKCGGKLVKPSSPTREEKQEG